MNLDTWWNIEDLLACIYNYNENRRTNRQREIVKHESAKCLIRKYYITYYQDNCNICAFSLLHKGRKKIIDFD